MDSSRVHRRTYPLWRRQPDDRGRNAGLPHCPNATFGPGSELISWVSSRVRVHYAPYQSTSALPRTSHPGGVGARGPLRRGKLIFFKAPVTTTIRVRVYEYEIPVCTTLHKVVLVRTQKGDRTLSLHLAVASTVSGSLKA